jgi:hypothetical protein
MSKITKALLLPLTFGLITACSGKETDADKIADAQSCLDTATASTAEACLAKIEGMESPASYLIRCVAKFAKEGYTTPSKISAALAAQTGGSTGSTNMMAALTFTTEATTTLNKTSSQQTYGYCVKSGSEGLIFLSGLVQTATTVGALAADLGGILAGGIENMTGDELKTAMDSLKSNPEAQAAVGSAVVGMYESSCTGSNNNANGDFCAQFGSVVASAGGVSNTDTIDQLIMNCYANPTDPGCTGF